MEATPDRGWKVQVKSKKTKTQISDECMIDIREMGEDPHSSLTLSLSLSLSKRSPTHLIQLEGIRMSTTPNDFSKERDEVGKHIKV